MSEPITNVEAAVRELDALPVPVGFERTPVQGQRRTMLDHARIALNARMTKDNLRLVLENVITYAASLETRIAELEAERHSTNEALSEAAEALRALRKDEPAEPRDFFQPGRTYLRFVGDREFYFRVTSVSTDNPNRSDSLAGDGPVAYGWGRTDRSTTVWGPTGQTSFVGWHDVTESGGV